MSRSRAVTATRFGWSANPHRLASALETIEAAYIIDGHHRVAATLRRGVSPNLPGGRFLAVAFPHDDLAVFPFHRWIDADLEPRGTDRVVTDPSTRGSDGGHPGGGVGASIGRR